MAPVQICVYLASEEDLRSLGWSLAFTLRLNFPTVARKGSVPQLQWWNWEDLKAPTAVATFRFIDEWSSGNMSFSAEVCKYTLPHSFYIYLFIIFS